MKINKKKMWEWIIAIAVVVIIIIFVNKVQNKYIERILNNAEYTTGKVFFFSGSKSGLVVPGLIQSTPKPTNAFTKYFVDNTEYENKNTCGPGIQYIPDTGIQKGDKFLVIYNKKKPKESCVLFDYPIKDNGDFERYVKNLKNNPEKIKNYHK